VSLSAWEQQALDSIRDGLAGSDPELSALLATFNRLSWGEDMPVREKIRPHRRRRYPPRSKVLRHVHRVYQRLGSQRVAFLLWLLITIVLITVGVSFSRGGSHGRCTESGVSIIAPAYSSCPRSSRHVDLVGP
jgi:hypothetical protein